MKTLVIAGSFILSLSSLLAQDIPVIVDGSNNSCEMAMQVCDPFQHYIIGENEFNNAGTIDCSQTPAPLFYSFNFVEGTNSSGIGFTAFNGMTGTYILYGPVIGTALDACTQVNANNATYTYGAITGGSPQSLPITSGGQYVLQMNFDNCVELSPQYDGICVLFNKVFAIDLDCDPKIDCANCVSSFAPTPGEYVVSAWVKEGNAPGNATTYSNASIQISFTGSAVTYDLLASGQIIDGWQKIDEVIIIPNGATALNLTMAVTSGEAFFDDIRFYPFDGSMMSYVYDPISLRLMAELDERNYATLYEYDEEGKLIRVKKETARGIMTIQENRDNITKQ